MAEKRYYWLKLKEDFFDGVQIKAMRKQPDGNKMIIVYLKLMLKCLQTNGEYLYKGLMPDCESEIALSINEDKRIVKKTIKFLFISGLIEKLDSNTIYLQAVKELTGSEADTAKRVRKYREKKRNEALHCNDDVTAMKQKCNTDIDIDIEKELEKERDTESASAHDRAHAHEEAFTPPTVEEVAAYCAERRNGIDAQYFVDYFAATGWMIGKTPMQDWKATVRRWERNGIRSAPKPASAPYHNHSQSSINMEEVEKLIHQL